MSSSERTDRATALITGASSGIGYQYARQLAARGYDLLIVSNDAEGIANSAAEIRKQYGVRVTPLYRDLSAENAAEDLYRYCEDEQLDVEVLVNNAGVFFFRRPGTGRFPADRTDAAAARTDDDAALSLFRPIHAGTRPRLHS